MRIACLSRFGRIAAPRARSLFAYPGDMSHRSLRGSLRFTPKKQISKGCQASQRFIIRAILTEARHLTK
jgi:hypothetical protein